MVLEKLSWPQSANPSNLMHKDALCASLWDEEKKKKKDVSFDAIYKTRAENETVRYVEKALCGGGHFK